MDGSVQAVKRHVDRARPLCHVLSEAVVTVAIIDAPLRRSMGVALTVM